MGKKLFYSFLFFLAAKLIGPLPWCEFLKKSCLLHFDLILMGGSVFLLMGGSVFLEIVFFFPMAGEGPCRDFYSFFYSFSFFPWPRSS